MKIIESTPFSVSPCGCEEMRWRGLCFAFRQLSHCRVFFWGYISCLHRLFAKKVVAQSSTAFALSFIFPHTASQYRFFRISVLKRTARKKEKSAMIEAKASRTRKRKETVFNEKKTVRDFGSSFGMSAMAEESVQARFTDYDQVNQTITVMPGRIPRRNWGISMASPPFWRWMDSSSRT